MSSKIPFNKPFVAGKELYYIAEAVTRGELAGDGHFTRQCAALFEERFGIHKVLMTPSGTAALEMAAMLCDLGPGDEVIMPSFTFVSTANAVVRLGAKPVFVDIRPDTLNLDENQVERAITEKTKAIFVVHYAGVGCEMDRIMSIATRHGLKVVEDAAHAVNARYRDRSLGAIGDLAAYSFHETKNFICGEGGALCINRPEMVPRAEIIRDKGTNRRQFLRGEVDKYTWIAVGSSYVPSEIVSAFLFGQLEMLEPITDRRRQIHETYHRLLQPLEAQGLLRLPVVPESCRSNFHLFYILLPDHHIREELRVYLLKQGINTVFHFVPLHSSPMGQQLGNRDGDLPLTEELSTRLLRLPLFYEISEAEQTAVASHISDFLLSRSIGRH